MTVSPDVIEFGFITAIMGSETNISLVTRNLSSGFSTR